MIFDALDNLTESCTELYSHPAHDRRSATAALDGPGGTSTAAARLSAPRVTLSRPGSGRRMHVAGHNDRASHRLAVPHGSAVGTTLNIVSIDAASPRGSGITMSGKTSAAWEQCKE